MICPSCDAEYEPGYRRCDKCDVDLVEPTAAAATVDPQAFVTIARFGDVASAMVARSRLEAEGIEVLIPDENIAALNWQYSSAVGGIRLQVDAARASEATAILGSSQQFAEPTFVNDRCPQCGSDELNTRNEARPWIGRIAVLLMFPFALLALPTLGNKDLKSAAAALQPWQPHIVYDCRRCRHTWRLPYDSTALNATQDDVPHAPRSEPPGVPWLFWVMLAAAAWMLHRYVS